MNIYFAASNHNLSDHWGDYMNIVDSIHEMGHSLTREWLEADRERQNERRTYTPSEYSAIWHDVKDAMARSEVVILEVSENTFSIGYQAAMALSFKKPVLLLAKNQPLSNTIIVGEDNPFLEIKEYADAKQLRSIIALFIERFALNAQDKRFNMMLDPETNVFLELESYRTGKTKARIIRELLRERMRDLSALS